MRYVCPGQGAVSLSAQVYPCPKCQTEVEIFSNEVKVKCYNCGEMVYQDVLPTCIDWCAAARECIGEERWKRLKGDAQPGQS